MSKVIKVIILEWDSDVATGVKSKEIKNMAKKKFDINNCKIRSFINDVPIGEYTDEEREILFEQMLINAVHAIGAEFEHEDEEEDRLLRIKVSEIIAKHSKGLSE